jgi:hypothetical protein
MMPKAEHCSYPKGSFERASPIGQANAASERSKILFIDLAAVKIFFSDFFERRSGDEFCKFDWLANDLLFQFRARA